MPQQPQVAASDSVDLGGAGSVGLDEVEDLLRGWVKSVDPDATVSFGPPKEKAAGRGVGLHLIDLARNPQLRGALAPAFQLQLGYSVTTWAEDPAAAERLLVDLALDAVGRTNVEVDFASRSADYWLAMGLAPKPSFTIRLPVRRERPVAVKKRVRFPLVVSSARRMVVAGVVRGPEDTPLPNAWVELVGLEQATKTDRAGRFAFKGVPNTEAGVRLRVRAKGVQLEVPVGGDEAAASDLSIQVDL